MRLKGDADLKKKDVIIVDDIVSTGGTITEVAKMCKRLGCKSVSFAFVHGLLVGDAVRKLKSVKPKKIVSTNTVENPFETVDITPLLFKFLKELIER